MCKIVHKLCTKKYVRINCVLFTSALSCDAALWRTEVLVLSVGVRDATLRFGPS